MGGVLIANARLVNPADGSAGEPADLWVSDGRLARCPGTRDEPVLDLAGRWVLPGLWDAHVHMTQWAMARRRLDLSGVRDTAGLLAALDAEVAQRPDWAHDPVVGVGVHAAGWQHTPTGEQLDALSATVPVVALSGDLHAAWANRAALERLGLAHLASGRLVEQDAFDVQLALNHATSATVADHDEWVAQAAQDAASRGVVGIVDIERSDNLADWARRMDAGFTTLRVRAAVWPELLHDRIARGVRTGDVVGGHRMLVQGPLKVIVDGSITAGTAWCREPYGDPPGTGRCNVEPDELLRLMDAATAAGIECAVHAIGDAAMDAVLDAFAESGATGSVEHAHLATADQAGRMAMLGLTASVQPQHLPGDRDPVERLWPGRVALPLGTLERAGVRLTLGSDAPVVPLNPWQAIQDAVTRTGDDRPAWHREECLTLSSALRASTNGVMRLVPGAAADLVALDHNPFDMDPGHLHTISSVLTLVAGEVTHNAL